MRSRSSWRRQVLYFAGAAVAAVVALLVVASRFSDDAALEEATKDATGLTELAASFVEPRVTPGLVEGRAAAIDRFDRAISGRMIGDRILRIKIWAEDGTIVYSDETRLIGRRFDLGAEELEVLRDGGAEAEPSDLAKPENIYERPLGELVEVYTQIHTGDGRPMLFEAYFSTSDVEARSSTIQAAFRPITIGVLLLFLAMSIPVVGLLARRLARAADERERLLHAAIEASDLERRRLARDLHDGVVQDLAGTAFAMAAVARRVDDDAGREVSRLAGQVRAGLRALRSLLVTLYPPDLHAGGLASALADLVSPATDAGVACEIDVPEDLVVTDDVAQVIWRVCNEAVRNALTHAAPTRVTIHVRQVADAVHLEVADDGQGFDTTAPAPVGHLGLRLLGDLARDLGGTLELRSVPGEGTVVTMEVPT